MRLSTKGRYSVTAMLDLAIHDKAGPVTLADISQCQGISLSYLEQLFARFARVVWSKAFEVPVVVIVWQDLLLKLVLQKSFVQLMKTLMLPAVKAKVIVRTGQNV